MPLVEVLGDTGQVGEDAALPDGGLALGRYLSGPGGYLVTGWSSEPLAGMWWDKLTPNGQLPSQSELLAGPR